MAWIYLAESEESQRPWKATSGRSPKGGMSRTGMTPDGKKRQVGLENAVKMWPTPTVQDAENDGGPSQYERNSLPLNAVVKMFPTPRANERGQYQRDGGQKGKERATLTGVAKNLPTPTSRAGQNPGEHGQGGQNLATVAGGQLNPTWVEWLMGYPCGWTVLEDWATQWFRPKREKRLKG